MEDILKKTTVKLERGGYSCTAVVLLQKNPPHDLLIGTDLLPFLGFQFVKETVNSGTALDMFSCKEYICNVGEVNKEKVGEPSKQDLNSSLKVKLISAVRVPALHEKLIKAKVCNSLIVLVAKRDGTTRFCVDNRRLNLVTRMDVFPLPRIDDSIDILSHSRYFSTLDLRSGY